MESRESSSRKCSKEFDHGTTTKENCRTIVHCVPCDPRRPRRRRTAQVRRLDHHADLPDLDLHLQGSREIEDYTRRGKTHYEYGRYGNPTATIAERRLADLEGAEDCVVFSSGMSAITTTILSLVQSGDHIVITDDSYKKTLRILPAPISSSSPSSAPSSRSAIMRPWSGPSDPNTRFIFSESPTNPYLNIFDLDKLREIGRRHKVLTLIDSTFATPYNQRPLEFGIDLVLQSCTKYLAGHNDILAGAVLGRTALIEKIRDLHKSMGGTIDPHCCYLLLRGLKTFPLRVARQNETALAIARWLESHPKIKRVYYPFLAEPSALQSRHDPDARRRGGGDLRDQGDHAPVPNDCSTPSSSATSAQSSAASRP